MRLLCNHLDRFKFCDAILWDTDLSFLRFDNVKLADNTTCHLSYENGIFLNYSLNLEAVFIIYLTDSEEQTKQSKNKNRKKNTTKTIMARVQQVSFGCHSKICFRNTNGFVCGINFMNEPKSIQVFLVL